jgi:hypothetical protein
VNKDLPPLDDSVLSVILDADLRGLLSTLSPTARDAFRRVPIHDQPDRDAWPSYAVWKRIAEFSGWPETLATGWMRRG